MISWVAYISQQVETNSEYIYRYNNISSITSIEFNEHILKFNHNSVIVEPVDVA